MNGQEYPAWSRDWSAPSDFDAPTGPIPVPVVATRAEQAAGRWDVHVVPTIIFAVSLLLAFPLTAGGDLISYGLTTGPATPPSPRTDRGPTSLGGRGHNERQRRTMKKGNHCDRRWRHSSVALLGRSRRQP